MNSRNIDEGQIKSAALLAVGPTIYSAMIDKSLNCWSDGLPAPFFMPAVFKTAVSYRLGFDVTKELDPVRYVSQISPVPVMYIQAEKEPNNAINSESQKPCAFVKLLWASGYGERYLEYKKKWPSFKTTNN